MFCPIFSACNQEKCELCQQSTLNLNREIYTHTDHIFYFWVHMCVFTIELRLVSPPGWRPISASLLASSTLLTPQFGATFPLQRIWTFILQTTYVKTQHTRWASQDNINKTDGNIYGDKDRWQGEKSTFAVQSLPYNAPQQRATVITEGRNLIIVNVELMGNIYTETLICSL